MQQPHFVSQITKKDNLTGNISRFGTVYKNSVLNLLKIQTWRYKMKRVVISLLALSAFIVVLAGCSNSPTSSTPTPTTHDISMVDSAFQPQNKTIAVGDTVRWTNNGARTHTSTSGTGGTADGTWDSGDITPGNTYERTFDTAGTFQYFCMHHWQTGMTGTITVQ
jgi:plastocyanin